MRVRRHIILVGLPGSGKSSVAPLVADLLGTTCSDVDAIVAADLGLTISEIFASRGEAAFRELEQDVVARLLQRDPHVIAPGGGWIVRYPEPAALAGRALIVYLLVEPEVAVERLSGPGGRPLLRPDPIGRMTELLAQRESLYRVADVAVDTSGRDVAAVAAEISGLARISAGW